LLAGARLWTIFESTDRQHVRTLALSLVAELRWWQSTPLLVRALDCGDQEPANRAEEYLRRKHNAHVLVARPTREELEALETALEKRRKLGKPALISLEEIAAYVRREMFPPRWR
jgi:hypothetical protein